MTSPSRFPSRFPREHWEHLFLNPIILAILFGTVFIILAWIGVSSSKTLDPIIYEIVIDPAKYPFEETPVELQKGDDVEIMILDADSATQDCGFGSTTVMGMVHHENQHNAVLPTANLCAVIGRIGVQSAPYFFVGAYTRFTVLTSGVLFLGINDVVPAKCSIPDCFAKNTGTVFVRVSVRKK